MEKLRHCAIALGSTCVVFFFFLNRALLFTLSPSDVLLPASLLLFHLQPDGKDRTDSCGNTLLASLAKGGQW